VPDTEISGGSLLEPTDERAVREDTAPKDGFHISCHLRGIQDGRAG
jgi:hypothetical protein